MSVRTNPEIIVPSIESSGFINNILFNFDNIFCFDINCANSNRKVDYLSRVEPRAMMLIMQYDNSDICRSVEQV